MSAEASVLPWWPKRDPITLFLIFSLLVHLILLVLIRLPTTELLGPEAEQLTRVELLPPEADIPPLATDAPQSVPEEGEEPVEEAPEETQIPEQLPQQIVSPPDEVNDQVPDATRLMSDRNTRVDEESVAIGTAALAPPQETEKTTVEEQQKPADEPRRLALTTPTDIPTPEPDVSKELDKALEESAAETSARGEPEAPLPVPQLFVSPDDLIAKGWLQDGGIDTENREARRRPPTGQELLAMAPPPRENFLSLPGPRGTLDNLPDIATGNITMLNTKANRFAPFVRRVAQRVFQHQIIQQRRSLQTDDVVAAQGPVTVGAKLDKKGNLRGLTIQTRSGSWSVDDALLEACRQGAWDTNPPPEALAEDGYFHFVFRSNLFAQFDAYGLNSLTTYLQVGLI